MIDSYSSFGKTPVSPIRTAVAVTPHDTNELAQVSRIFVGVAGNISVILADDSSAVTFKGVQGFLPMLVKQVRATGTTATDIVACR